MLKTRKEQLKVIRDSNSSQLVQKEKDGLFGF